MIGTTLGFSPSGTALNALLNGKTDQIFIVDVRNSVLDENQSWQLQDSELLLSAFLTDLDEAQLRLVQLVVDL